MQVINLHFLIIYLLNLSLTCEFHPRDCSNLVTSCNLREFEIQNNSIYPLLAVSVFNDRWRVLDSLYLQRYKHEQMNLLMALTCFFVGSY